MIEVEKFASNLQLGNDNIWYSKTKGKISYPKEGNQYCVGVEQNSFWFNHRNACIVETMRNYPPPGPLFDVGGGNGYVSLAIKDAGMETVVTEPGIQGALNSLARGLQPIICSTVQDAGFKANSLPAIGMFDVLEHIENDSEFMVIVKNLLIPDGRIYITVPAYNFLFSKEDEYAGHFRRYDLNGLSKKLNSAGYKIEYKTYIFSFLPIPIFLLRTLPSRLGIFKNDHFIPKIKEHDTVGGVFGTILDCFLKAELHLIKAQWALPFGGSCLLVASPV